MKSMRPFFLTLINDKSSLSYNDVLAALVNDNAYAIDFLIDMAMSKIFNVVALYDFHLPKLLYPDNNLRISSFEEG